MLFKSENSDLGGIFPSATLLEKVDTRIYIELIEQFINTKIVNHFRFYMVWECSKPL